MLIFFVLKQKIVEYSAEFHEMSEVIFRFETLYSNYFELLNKDKENENKLIEEHQKLNLFTEVLYLLISVYIITRLTLRLTKRSFILVTLLVLGIEGL